MADDPIADAPTSVPAPVPVPALAPPRDPSSSGRVRPLLTPTEIDAVWCARRGDDGTARVTVADLDELCLAAHAGHELATAIRGLADALRAMDGVVDRATARSLRSLLGLAGYAST